jgi:hypothetical protein
VALDKRGLDKTTINRSLREPLSLLDVAPIVKNVRQFRAEEFMLYLRYLICVHFVGLSNSVSIIHASNKYIPVKVNSRKVDQEGFLRSVRGVVGKLVNFLQLL